MAMGTDTHYWLMSLCLFSIWGKLIPPSAWLRGALLGDSDTNTQWA